MKINNKLLLYILFIFCLISGIAAQQLWQQYKNNNYFPDFVLTKLINSQVINHKSLLGSPALINFWASWCVACRDEHAFLMQLNNNNIKIYGVNYQDQRAAALAWLKELGNPYQFSLYDGAGYFRPHLAIAGIPQTFLLNSQGKIVQSYAGVLKQEVWDELFADKWYGLIN